MPGDGQEPWLCPHAPTRLAWPPGGARKLAVGPQLLTVSGAPLHGLWLCLIEDQGYGRRRSRSRARTVCAVVGCGRYIQKMWEAGCQDVGGHLACGQSGHGGGTTCEVAGPTGAASGDCHHVACSCRCHNKAQAQARLHEPDVTAPRC